MRLRPSSGNLAKAGLRLALVAALLSGCSSSTQPSYSTEQIPGAIEEICRREYKLNVVSRIADNTLWIYLPLQEPLFSPADKWNTLRFQVKTLDGAYTHRIFAFDFDIQEHPPRKERQGIEFAKDPVRKHNQVRMVTARVLFSSKTDLEFTVMVIADILHGMDIRYTMYVKDFKKYAYNLISATEFSLRMVQDFKEDKAIIGDTRGDYLEYEPVRMPGFLARQIQQRIRVNFQEETLQGRKFDPTAEITRLVAHCLSTYGFEDFSWIELKDMATQKRTLLNRKSLRDYLNY